jgi:hypothetical protein
MMKCASVKRRLVLQVAGYEAVDAARHRRRFLRGMPEFARTWNVALAATETGSARASGSWSVTTRGANWRVDSVFEPLVWSDVVASDETRPMWRRLAMFAASMADFIGSGTARRYFHAQWKYGLFFLFPLFHLLSFACWALATGYIVANMLLLKGAAMAAVTAAVSVPAFLILLHWLGRRWRVLQAADDWIFAGDLVHSRRFDIEARLNQFAQRIADAARDRAYDEILVVGHSLGATLAVGALSRALNREPELGRNGTPVLLVTVGSTIPKFTLHPDAVRVRLDVARVASSSVQWAEFHARADPISFYRFDPATGTKTDDRLDRQPLIRMVRMRHMVRGGTYRRIQYRFMRLHHQFVMANECRYWYDFYMMCCGPVPVFRMVLAPAGLNEFIEPDGSVIETVAAPAVAAARDRGAA